MRFSDINEQQSKKTNRKRLIWVKVCIDLSGTYSNDKGCDKLPGRFPEWTGLLSQHHFDIFREPVKTCNKRHVLVNVNYSIFDASCEKGYRAYADCVALDLTAKLSADKLMYTFLQLNSGRCISQIRL